MIRANPECDGYIAVGAEIKGEAVNTFAWTGLDDGIYRLIKTAAPAGYNAITRPDFTIIALVNEEGAVFVITNILKGVPPPEKQTLPDKSNPPDDPG